MTWQPELDELRRRQELADRMGGPEKVQRQHEAGRLTVRERLAALLGAARLCMAHLSILVEGTAQLFVAGPPVVKSGSGEDVDKEGLGGSRVHGRNGAVDLVASSELEAFRMIRRFLSYLPQSAYERPPVSGCEDPAGRRDDSLLSAVPRDRRQPYRIRAILRAVFDADSVMEGQRYGGTGGISPARPRGASGRSRDTRSFDGGGGPPLRGPARPGRAGRPCPGA